MADVTLVIADKNYCLWPLSAWLCLRAADIEFDEVRIRFTDPDRRAKMLEYGPTGRVPVLKHGNLTVWDSLAICEYVAELSPETRLWPEDRAARATARAFSCEMHAGGEYPGAVRHIAGALNTNVRGRTDSVTPTPAVQEAIEHLTASWRRLRADHGGGGPFLFGHFTIADAMTAHLVNRLVTYSVPVADDTADYIAAVRGFAPMQRWIAEATAEDSTLPAVDRNFPQQG